MIMNRLKFFLPLLALLFVSPANAQFSQAGSDYEYMFKGEVGYMPFVSNLGHEGENGYYINDLRHIVNVNVINGVNIKQNFFVGLGLGYGYVTKPDDFSTGWHSALAFVDFDYRPLDVEWSPMVGARAGAHYMMADSPYGNTLTPYFEISTGLNWFFRHEYRNMERNYLSIFLELAFAYTQQTTFIPIRLGFRF